MSSTYAVTWQETGEPSRSGKLELLASGLKLVGGRNGDTVVVDVAYDDLREVRVGRAAGERIGDRPTLVLDRRSRGAVRIAGVAQSGMVAELAERLARVILAHRSPSPVVIVVPLKVGAHERVRELVANGPPFDLRAAGLERHDFFVTERDAVFVFEASSRVALERFAGAPELWAAAEAWRDSVAGPARLADRAYSWARSPGPGV
jgi:hypothetical protein